MSLGDRQTGSPDKPENHSIDALFSEAYSGLGNVVRNVDASAANLAASVHLPALHIDDAGGAAAKQGPKAEPNAQINISALVIEAGNTAKAALGAIEHHPFQTVEVAAASSAAPSASASVYRRQSKY
jgi:hypothetical protein